VDLSVLKRSNVQLIRLRGRLSLGSAVDSFRDALEHSLSNGDTQIMVNLAEVPMMDSSGIGLLVRYQTLAKQKGGSIKLVKPSEFATKTLKMVGLLQLFEVFDSEDAAAASFQG
jgi:anti-anti-sigma factor